MSHICAVDVVAAASAAAAAASGTNARSCLPACVRVYVKWWWRRFVLVKIIVALETPTT